MLANLPENYFPILHDLVATKRHKRLKDWSERRITYSRDVECFVFEPLRGKTNGGFAAQFTN